MALRQWNQLKQDEVNRADALGLRVMMAILLKHIIDSAADKEAVASGLRAYAEGVIRALPPSEAVPPARRGQYVECAIDSAHRLIANSLSIQRTPIGPTKH